MLCGSCYYENEKDALFCSRCGGSLEAVQEGGNGSLMEDDVFTEYVREKLADKYRITRVLGRGGMAVVFEAIELQLNRKVALKALPMEHAHSQDLVRRFKQEAQLAAGLHHPHIIPIFSVGSVDRIHYFTMSYLECGALEERIKQGMYLRDTISIVKQVADALNYAHEKKLIHRDIKPANIMFDEHGAAYVADFGIAKAVVNTMVTATQSFFGTPHYMSPEQVVDDRIDGRSDLYSLGVIFYQMVTGKLPFDGSEALSVMYKHVNDEATPPNKLQKIPDDVSGIIMKLLAKDRDKRYQTGEALLADLEALPQALSQTKSRAKQPPPNPELAQTPQFSSVAVELAPPPKRGPMSEARFSRNMGTVFHRLKKDGRTRTGLMGGIVLVLVVLLGVLLLMRNPEAPVQPEPEPPTTVDQFARGELVHQREQAPPVSYLASGEASEPELETPIASQDEPAKAVKKPPVRKPTRKKPKADPLREQRNVVKALLKEMGEVTLPGGPFMMGSKTKIHRSERPVHQVTVSGFTMGATEVNQKLWKAVMGSVPLSACASGEDLPIGGVSWDQCQEFIQKLNTLTRGSWRLPTEAEWEYACQYGGEGVFGDLVWHSKIARGPNGTKSKKAAPSGLYHMRGNVWEWVSDYYDKRYYKDSPSENPTGPVNGTTRVIRGGSWAEKANQCRCSKRESRPPAKAECEVGFRLVR